MKFLGIEFKFNGFDIWHKGNFNPDKKADTTQIPTKVGQLENDEGYVTQTELGNAGYGDMMKAVYDTNDDGIVDVAETVIGNEIQLGSYKLVYNSTTNSLDIEVVA